MKKLASLVKGLCSGLDKLAGLCIFSVMLLIVANIILRTLFNRPILGTYEWVGFLTALGVAFALAHCAFQDGHIAISFIVEYFNSKIQAILAVVVHAVSFVLWIGAAWALAKFGYAMKVKGLIAPSSEIPVYPFIYLIAIGLIGLALVLMFKVLVTGKEVLRNNTTKKVTS